MLLPSEICLDRERLLRAASAAIHAHSSAVGQLQKVVGHGDSEDFETRAAAARRSYLTAMHTWGEYQDHLNQHKCG